MATSNIKMHVKQDSVYDQKHPQTNSKQVLLNDNSTLEAYLKQGTTFRLVDGMLVFKDPATGTDMTLSTSSLTNRSIGNVSNLALESLLNMANIKWEDPKDTTIATSGESVTITSWAGTKVVVKEGSVPRDANDGTLVVDSKVRNQYKSTGLDISNLMLGKNYYVKLFPYTTEGVFTNDNTNSVHINTNGTALDIITDITIESVGDTVFARFTDPENKTGVYKGQTYTTAEYAGTKVVMKKGSAPSNHMDGTVVADYVNRNQHNTNENILKIKMPSEGTWYVTIFNHTTQGVYSQKVNTMTITFLPLDTVTNLSVTTNELTVTVKWDDPQDKQHFLGTDHTVAIWSGTKLVRKEGSEPTDVNDGVLLLDSKTRNQYSEVGFIDSSVTEGMTYHYKLFPYTDTGKVTNDAANSESVTPLLLDDNSGSPGPSKLLGGDTTAGYYGVVPPSELITGSQLATKIGLSTGTTQFDNEGWLKFNIDNKIIFVAKKPFKSAISWDQINVVGAVMGTKMIDIGGLTYRVRLLKGAENNPSNNNDLDRDAIGSEWNRLMLPIHEQAETKAWASPAYVEPSVSDWGIGFTDADLMTHYNHGGGSYTWCQETATSDSTYRITRGFNGVSFSNWSPSSSPNSSCGWRPVLELVGPTLVDVYGTPGPRTVLARGEKEGYFGVVTSTSLIKGTELASKIGLTSGSIIYDTEGWLKFFIDDKIIFVAKKPYRHSVSWDKINAAGAVFGSKIINIGGLDYKVRLIQGAENNPSKDSDVDRDAIGSEWNRLMLPIHTNAKTNVWSYPNNVGAGVSNWGIGFTDADLNTDANASLGSYTWCQEAITSNTTNRVVRGAFEVSHAGWYQSNAETGAFAWRPVLELIPPPPIEDTTEAPGPKATVGQNTTAGYFGIVQPSELISGPDLATEIDLISGKAINDTEGWLKFIIDGKILFVAKKPFKHTITWSAINAKGAVYGAKPIIIGDQMYKVRLMRGAKNDPANLNASNNDAPESEWNRLMLPIYISAKDQSWSYPSLVEPNCPDWGVRLTANDLGMSVVQGRGSWCQERNAMNTNNRIIRGSTTGIEYLTSALYTDSHAEFGWRPVLEYIGPVIKDSSGSPGATETIARGENEGYFGIVAPTDLIKGSELATQIGLNTGTEQFDNEGWLKFVIDGKILFVAKKPFRHSVTWDEINTVGAALGTKIISVKGLTYRVRLLKGSQNNPSRNTDADRDAIGSEWNRLMLPIHVQAKTKAWSYPAYTGPDVPDWGIGLTDTDLHTSSNLGSGISSWCQETISNYPNERVTRGYLGVSSSSWYTFNVSYTDCGWRPVLELVQ